MTAGDSATVTSIHRYPVKGLSAEPLDRADLEIGRCLAFDRVYAVENGGREFDPDNPRHMQKIKFLMLMRNERLASLETRFDDATHTLTIHRAGRQVAAGRLDTPIGRQLIEQFLAAFLPEEIRGTPRIVCADGHNFTDVDAKWLSVINLASVRDLARVMQTDIHPLRFRANIYIDGIEPWREFTWIDRDIAVDGIPVLHAMSRIQRCAAVNVDPLTGARDLAIPRALTDAFGHMDMGIYVAATAASAVAVGSSLSVV